MGGRISLQLERFGTREGTRTGRESKGSPSPTSIVRVCSNTCCFRGGKARSGGSMRPVQCCSQHLAKCDKPGVFPKAALCSLQRGLLSLQSYRPAAIEDDGEFPNKARAGADDFRDKRSSASLPCPQLRRPAVFINCLLRRFRKNSHRMPQTVRPFRGHMHGSRTGGQR
jgi:hypothetical protein